MSSTLIAIAMFAFIAWTLVTFVMMVANGAGEADGGSRIIVTHAGHHTNGTNEQ
jgi:hypothetical protein